MAVKFSSKNSGNQRLYINMENISGWSAYFYSGTVKMPDELSIQETWKSEGRKSAYIFSRNSPENAGDFADRLKEYLDSKKDTRIYCLWIKNIEAPLDEKNIDKLSADKKNTEDLTDRDIHILTGGFIWLSVLQNCIVTLNEEKEQIEIQRGFAGSDITFYNSAFQTKSQVGKVLAVPFSGKLAGCICFLLNVRGIQGLKDYRVKLLYRDSSLNLDYEYPIFSCNYRENILFRASIDPLDQYNRGGSARTYLAFGKEQEAVPSCFRSIYGEEILLKPYVEYSAEDEYQISEHSAAVVFQTWEKEREDSVYMVLWGDFYLWGTGVKAYANTEQNILRLLCGLSGLEYIECKAGNKGCEGDILRFLPNHPAEYTQSGDSFTKGDILDDRYQTAWFNVLPPASSGREVCYISQPAQAALYGAENSLDEILAYMPCKTAVLTEEQVFPMVPYSEVARTGADFERNVLMRERNRKIYGNIQIQKKAKQGEVKQQKVKDGTLSWSTTPQGLLAEVEEETGQWTRLLLGTSLSAGGSRKERKNLEFLPDSGQLYLNSFLKNAFQNNSMFLVVSQKKDGVLGDFKNEITIEDWTFSLNVPESSSLGEYRNILIFKFCSGKIQELVKDTTKWTEPERFNNENTLSMLSQWISDYIENGIESCQKNQNADFADFACIVQDENYQGILALKTDISISSFPKELRGLLGGIDLSRFCAHHFGVNINRVELDEHGKLSMKKNSSMFGLIHYIDIDFENAGCDIGVYRGQKRNIDSLDYDFRVLFLSILFKNSKIITFGSIICFIINKIFGASVDTFGRDNILILNGNMEHQGNVPAYSFHNTRTGRIVLQNSTLLSLDIMKTEFQTVSENEETSEIVSYFSLGGYMAFKQLDFDVFSYGGDNCMEIGKGLAFSNLKVQMSFSADAADKKSYLLCTETMSFDSSRSCVREHSLVRHFPVKFSSLLCGNSNSTLSEQGYEVIDTPDLKSSKTGDDWFGLNFILDLGSLGELAADSGFQAEFMAVWQKENRAVAVKFPGITNKSGTFSLNGILKLEIQKIKLVQAVSQEGKPAYLLMMNRICLKLLGLKFPKDAAIDFYIFGNPDNRAENTGLAWYAAYQAEDEKERR